MTTKEEKKKKRAQCLKKISTTEIKNFRDRYPNLDINNLTAGNPPDMSNVDLSNKRMAIAKQRLGEVTTAVLCGTLVGDAFIDRSSKTPRIQMRHSTRQTDWFMWKTLCALGSLVFDTSISLQLPDGFQRNSSRSPGEILGKWHVGTLRKDQEKQTAVLDIVAPGNAVVLERSWLNHMNNYFLMTLWLDDGSLTTYSREAEFCLYSNPKEELEVLAKYLETVWDIRTIVRPVASRATRSNPTPFTLAIADLDNTEKLLRIIAPIIPVESMLYKVCFCPLDSNRQQRWASEIKTLVRAEWHDTIDKYINYQLALRNSDISSDDPIFSDD